MSRADRKQLIERLQTERGNRLVITYITSTRPGHEIQIADDAFRVIYEHLEAGRDLAQKGVDLFIHSNGGSGTVPWRIVSLIRQYSEDFAVLVPHHAFSAATLIALGATKIVMHKMGCLGPIDPSVANIFNPPNPSAPGQLAPISVEDVTAFFRFVKEDVGVTHEDELVQAVIALTEKVHPLALGNVQRHNNQSRMMARKLLTLHTSEAGQHEIEQIIDNLKSKLFYHGHPINRVEASKDLKLKVEIPSEEVESAMWQLYLAYERDMKLREPFNVLRELELKQVRPQTPPHPTTDQIIKQLGAMAQLGLGLGTPGVTEAQLVKLAAAMIPLVSTTQIQDTKVELDPLVGAYVESAARVDVFRTKVRVERASATLPTGPQEVIKQEVLEQGWKEEI